MQATVLGDTYAIDDALLDVDEPALRRQLAEYEAGERREFDVTVEFPDGFRGEIMRAMTAIPFGETRTYGDLAADLDSAGMAVGQACGANPIPVVVPCHRVVAVYSLGGFSAQGGTAAKRRLLEFERGEGPQSQLDAF
ncbi:MAG: methylated-DNA--[protein]-cysteine S-methyltransferase [Halopenitus sp.]